MFTPAPVVPASYFEMRKQGTVLRLHLKKSVSSLSDERILDEVDTVVASLKEHVPDAVVVDLSSAPYFGSCLLEVLRHIHEEAGRQGAKMVLYGASPIAREVLEISHFNRLIPLVSTEDQALKSLVA
ncbi:MULTISPECIES: STAS domain-containing protein [Planctopirus]|nr:MULTISPECIES: STAS domain-containing protein [Planctopirus]QDV31584.1 STAS domain protein [Planctopirus ephydatiae]